MVNWVCMCAGCVRARKLHSAEFDKIKNTAFGGTYDRTDAISKNWETLRNSLCKK